MAGMLPVDTRIWGDRIPGYIPDSDEEFDEEEEEFLDACEERLDAITGTLGPKHVDVPIVEFAAASLHQKGPSTLKVTPPPPAALYGTRPPIPSFRIEHVHAPIVAKTFMGNGLVPTGNKDWTVQWSGPGMSDSGYQSLNEFQRVNHFPGSTELTRKDRLWKHFDEMKRAHGSDSFDFVPDSYVIPDQVEKFLDVYEKQTNWTWIVKPNCSSQGKGIFLLRNLSELPLDECSVVSRYVDNPLLIQGLKWDLRIYVLVTSYTPLRAYVYREGLTRFATSPYSTDPEHIQDAYRHLTNYSVNKTSVDFMENQEVEADNFGHKWSLSALNKHLKCCNINVDLMWARIMDLIVKTLLSVEPSIAQKTRQVTVHPNCFECYGFDVLVDDQLKPWLLEVNLSPSMKADSPLDWKVKSSLLADAFNLVGICSPDRQTSAASRLRTRILQVRQATINNAENQASRSVRRNSGPDSDKARPPSGVRGRPPSSGSHVRPPSSGSSFRPPSTPVARQSVDLDRLPEDQLKMLAQALQEVRRCHNFIRLHPTRTTCERYMPISEGRGQRGPRGADFSEAFLSSQSAATRLLASVLFGASPTGVAARSVSERRLAKSRFLSGCVESRSSSRGSIGYSEPRSESRGTVGYCAKQDMMQSLESKSTKPPSDDGSIDSDVVLSEADSKEVENRTDVSFLLQHDIPFCRAEHAKAKEQLAIETKRGWAARPARAPAPEGAAEHPGAPPLSPSSVPPPKSFLDGHRAARQPPIQPLARQPVGILRLQGSKSTPVLPKLNPEATQYLRIRHDSGQWLQTESSSRPHQQILSELSPSHAVKTKRNVQSSMFESLTMSLGTDIEL